ncbi:g7373 [Coccomyxa viridis]|uniref:G7373 protein n=1 Tax=Coccomyxa viridis TaxID=1274662 RepID=A0ABP1G1R7_9CHLO
MPFFLEGVKSWLSALLARLAALVSEASPGTLQLTGVLGLAAVVYGLYALRPKPDRGPSNHPYLRAPAPAVPSSAPSRTPQQRQGEASTSQQQAVPKASGQGLAYRIRDVKTVLVSAPGVLLEEWSPEQLQESATLRPAAAEVLKEVRRTANVYIIAHVVDDLGEATVRGALEAGGLVGSGGGQIAPHRVLCCSTLEGKISIARQLEPGLHIDSHPATVSAFLPALPIETRTPEPAPG